MSIKSIAAIAISIGSVIGLAGCAPTATPSSEPIVIGSQAYYSNEIIAEAYALVLEDAGFTVERTFSLGQRDVYVPAIVAGEVDLFPEYTGNLLQSSSRPRPKLPPTMSTPLSRRLCPRVSPRSRCHPRATKIPTT
jgi:glycine betaine/choline ABC-type transport system substrate-binding protein